MGHHRQIFEQHNNGVMVMMFCLMQEWSLGWVVLGK